VPFYVNDDVRIRYEETGTGFPLLIIPGGGLNAKMSFFDEMAPFDAVNELKDRYRCITFDLRNSIGGGSSGPLEVDRPWDTHTDDQLGLMDHLRVDKFMIMGFCGGCCLVWNMLQRAADRVVAAVLAQPSGFRPEVPDFFYDINIKGWGPDLCAARPDITPEMVDSYLTKMYRSNPDFVLTVSREFVRSCPTPILVLPDDIVAHPYEVAMESALLAPNAQVSLYPWKEPQERIPLAVRHIRTFLHAYDPGVVS
jgi:pimeloyl-ACP methyl ester carboxylesterase